MNEYKYIYYKLHILQHCSVNDNGAKVAFFSASGGLSAGLSFSRGRSATRITLCLDMFYSTFDIWFCSNKSNKEYFEYTKYLFHCTKILNKCQNVGYTASLLQKNCAMLQYVACCNCIYCNCN